MKYWLDADLENTVDAKAIRSPRYGFHPSFSRQHDNTRTKQSSDCCRRIDRSLVLTDNYTTIILNRLYIYIYKYHLNIIHEQTIYINI